MRINRLTILLPLANCGLISGVLTPLHAGAAYGGGSAAVCAAPRTYWQFSDILSVTGTVGTVAQWYGVPDAGWPVDTFTTSYDPVCALGSADAWYFSGQQVPPVPVEENVHLNQPPGDGQWAYGSYVGGCAEATVTHQFNQPAQDGLLIGGSVYVGYPNTISNGTTDAGAWTEVDVLYPWIVPCLTNVFEGAGAEGGGYAFAVTP